MSKKSVLQCIKNVKTRLQAAYRQGVLTEEEHEEGQSFFGSIAARNEINIHSAIDWLPTENLLTCLEILSDGNRKLLQATVVKYAEDMKKGTFYTGNDAFLIQEDGSLANGHHRTAAYKLALSQCGKLKIRHPWMMRIGATQAEVSAIDRGNKRSIADRMYFEKQFQDLSLTEKDMRVGKDAFSFFANGITINQLPDDVAIELVVKFKHARDFLWETGLFNSKKGVSQPVKVAFLRAFYAAREEGKLKELEALARIVAGGYEVADKYMDWPGRRDAVALWEKLNGDWSQAHGHSRRVELYCKLTSTIRRILDGKEVLKFTSQDLFPIPGDILEHAKQYSNKRPETICLERSIDRRISEVANDWDEGDHPFDRFVEEVATRSTQPITRVRSRLKKQFSETGTLTLRTSQITPKYT